MYYMVIQIPYQLTPLNMPIIQGILKYTNKHSNTSKVFPRGNFKSYTHHFKVLFHSNS